MLLDYQNTFSSDQAITATAASTNILDLGADHADTPNPSLKGEGGRIQVIVTTAFTNLTSLDVALQMDTLEAMSSPTTVDTQNVLLAALVVGKTLEFEIPAGCERYIRMYYTVNGSAPDAGKITAAYTLDRPINR